LVAAASAPSAATGPAPAPPEAEADMQAQAAEADEALDRFTDFLARHESELQPRTRQVCKL
jgi:hypothetical protein